MFFLSRYIPICFTKFPEFSQKNAFFTPEILSVQNLAQWCNMEALLLVFRHWKPTAPICWLFWPARMLMPHGPLGTASVRSLKCWASRLSAMHCTRCSFVCLFFSSKKQAYSLKFRSDKKTSFFCLDIFIICQSFFSSMGVGFSLVFAGDQICLRRLWDQHWISPLFRLVRRDDKQRVPDGHLPAWNQPTNMWV